MRKLAHIGIPTKTKPEAAAYVEVLKVHITNPADSKHNVEWLYFEQDTPMDKFITENVHLAYFVEDIESELKDAEILWPLTDMGTMKIAFIAEDGIPVELVQLA